MLQVFSVEQREEWDSLVRSFQNYDIYWLSGYVKAFQIHGDGEPLLFYYTGSTARGINVVMKRDVSMSHHFCDRLTPGTYFDFSTPYGYGGWIIEGEQTDDLFQEYEAWCIDNGIISEFVRFHPVLKNHQFSINSYEIVPLGNTVVMDIESPDIIWANITSKNRNVIRKAIKNGIKIYNGRYPEIFEEFRFVYNQTMDKDNADKYYYFDEEFYKSVCDDMPNNVQVFYAVFDNKVIAASIMLFANGKMNYHLSGSVKDYAKYAPSNLLLYKAALWGCENGYKSLYLGGGVGSGEDSLFKFKKAFYRNDDLPRFYIGKKVWNQEKYNELVNMREETDSSFFPKYRA